MTPGPELYLLDHLVIFERIDFRFLSMKRVQMGWPGGVLREGGKVGLQGQGRAKSRLRRREAWMELEEPYSGYGLSEFLVLEGDLVSSVIPFRAPSLLAPGALGRFGSPGLTHPLMHPPLPWGPAKAL